MRARRANWRYPRCRTTQKANNNNNNGDTFRHKHIPMFVESFSIYMYAGNDCRQLRKKTEAKKPALYSRRNFSAKAVSRACRDNAQQRLWWRGRNTFILSVSIFCCNWSSTQQTKTNTVSHEEVRKTRKKGARCARVYILFVTYRITNASTRFYCAAQWNAVVTIFINKRYVTHTHSHTQSDIYDFRIAIRSCIVCVFSILNNFQTMAYINSWSLCRWKISKPNY